MFESWFLSGRHHHTTHTQTRTHAPEFTGAEESAAHTLGRRRFAAGQAESSGGAVDTGGGSPWLRTNAGVATTELRVERQEAAHTRRARFVFD